MGLKVSLFLDYEIRLQIVYSALSKREADLDAVNWRITHAEYEGLESLTEQVFPNINSEKDLVLKLSLLEISILTAYVQSMLDECSDAQQSQEVNDFIKYLKQKRSALFN